MKSYLDISYQIRYFLINIVIKIMRQLCKNIFFVYFLLLFYTSDKDIQSICIHLNGCIFTPFLWLTKNSLFQNAPLQGITTINKSIKKLTNLSGFLRSVRENHSTRQPSNAFLLNTLWGWFFSLLLFLTFCFSFSFLCSNVSHIMHSA